MLGGGHGGDEQDPRPSDLVLAEGPVEPGEVAELSGDGQEFAGAAVGEREVGAGVVEDAPGAVALVEAPFLDFQEVEGGAALADVAQAQELAEGVVDLGAFEPLGEGEGLEHATALGEGAHRRLHTGHAAGSTRRWDS